MNRTSIAALVLLACVGTARAQEPKTYFDYVEGAFAVADIHPVEKPLEFRKGMVLAFPAQITDVIYARVGKPGNAMIVFEKHSADDKPPFVPGKTFFAPIRVMPQYSFWRDNLPATPRHEILGGSRYVFQNDDIEEAKRVTRLYAATLTDKSAERWPDEANAIIEALFSKLKVFTEDATRKLANSPNLLKAMKPDARTRLAEFLGGSAPEDLRLRLIGALGTAGITEMAPELEKLAKRDDATGAAALRALDQIGQGRATHALLDLSRAKSEPVRAFAYEALGGRAARDREAFEAAVRALKSDEPAAVRMAAARGLGLSRDEAAVEPLSAALARNDQASQASAKAIAAIGGTAAAESLKHAITDGPGDSKSAAVVAIVELSKPCADCMEFLRTQYLHHEDQGVRQLIGVMLELNVKHKH
jgi:HEAT repeat protein